MNTLVWLRRDLRLHDQAALAKASELGAPVQPIFVFDTEILSRFSNPNDRRLSFLVHTLQQLHRALLAQGGGLLVAYGRARDLVPKLAHALQATAICTAEDMEPSARARDAQVQRAFAGQWLAVTDHLVCHPSRIVKADGTPYKVFTPYYKAWRAAITPLDSAPYEAKTLRYADSSAMRARAVAAGVPVIAMDLPPQAICEAIGYRAVAEEEWLPEKAGAQLEAFIASRVTDYPQQRDYPAIQGTSAISPYIRFGVISIRECLRRALERGQADTWIKELAWREFYAQILYHFPETAQLEFEPKYRGTIPWSSNPQHISAFTQGRTGYPIVDAGVRELLSRGWMHNRVRMIVASFVSKDLLLDWRIGEEFFAQHLMDYEQASNVGGWQWSASTGTDAAPYFRVFNPVLQSKKFDEQGAYIRRYIPEIAHLSNTEIHAPWESANPPSVYPAPIVDHFAARERAIAAFKISA